MGITVKKATNHKPAKLDSFDQGDTAVNENEVLLIFCLDYEDAEDDSIVAVDTNGSSWTKREVEEDLGELYHCEVEMTYVVR